MYIAAVDLTYSMSQIGKKKYQLHLGNNSTYFSDSSVHKKGGIRGGSVSGKQLSVGVSM